jgi:hypothetical protein
MPDYAARPTEHPRPEPTFRSVGKETHDERGTGAYDSSDPGTHLPLFDSLHRPYSRAAAGARSSAGTATALRPLPQVRHRALISCSPALVSGHRPVSGVGTDIASTCPGCRCVVAARRSLATRNEDSSQGWGGSAPPRPLPGGTAAAGPCWISSYRSPSSALCCPSCSRSRSDDPRARVVPAVVADASERPSQLSACSRSRFGRRVPPAACPGSVA